MCDEQTECPWPTCQKAPSVALTRGWERHDLLADLGNNAARPHSDELEVMAFNERAKALYEALGFKVQSQIMAR